MKERKMIPSEFSLYINRTNGWIPVAWPHDGLNREKGSGTQLKEYYTANLLEDKATFENGTNNVEPGITEILDRMRTGRFKVFSTCEKWLEEFRLYHRKDGKIVKTNDDALDATRYALMMLRYAISEHENEFEPDEDEDEEQTVTKATVTVEREFRANATPPWIDLHIEMGNDHYQVHKTKRVEKGDRPPGDKEQQVLDLIRTKKKGEPGVSYKTMEEELKIPRSELTALCQTLKDKGLIERKGPGWVVK